MRLFDPPRPHSPGEEGGELPLAAALDHQGNELTRATLNQKGGFTDLDRIAVTAEAIFVMPLALAE